METPLKLARIRSTMTQKDVAKGVGIERSTYSRIENYGGASSAVAKRLADFFGKPLTREQILYPEEFELFPEKEQPPRRPVDSVQVEA